MSLSLSNESKNSATQLTNDDKYPNTTWDEATYTWDQAEGTWDVPGLVAVRESKNSLSMSNEAKN